jgi:hypothetical protein
MSIENISHPRIQTTPYEARPASYIGAPYRMIKGEGGASAGLRLMFAASTADADPGAGKFRFNNATVALATCTFIDDAELGGGAIGAFVDTFDDAGGSVKGVLTLINLTTPAIFAIFAVTGAVVAGSGYRKVNLSYIAGAGAFDDGAVFGISFSRAGELGPSAPGLPFKPSVGRVFSSSLTSTTFISATASVADVAHLVPIVASAACTIDEIQVNVSGAVASAEGKIGLFRSDANGRPSTLIEECAAAVSFATGGVKNATLSAPVAIAKGEIVWVSIRHSHAGVTLSAAQIYATMTIDHGTAVTTLNKFIRKTGVTYASAMPSSWSYSDADLTTGVGPIVGLRIAS